MKRTFRQPNIRDDILLILDCTENARRELCLRLLGIDGRRIDIAALSARPIECDIPNALAGGRSRQTFGDLRLAREIPLARRIGRVPELVRERIERRADKVLVSCRCRFRVETDAVRHHLDETACCRLTDRQLAAVDRRR